MKRLMLGNEAVARGLYEAGCRVVSSYPGTPSTEISEYVAKYEEVYAEWAPNEKVAAEVAIGASFGGARSFCAMKHVGLNVAADPVFTSSYTGVRRYDPCRSRRSGHAFFPKSRFPALRHSGKIADGGAL